MSYTLILLLVTFVLAMAECLATGHERLQRQIYYIAFAFTVVWCTAKYAYGADIANYIPFYEKLAHPSVEIHTHSVYFEKGFVMFCSILKWMGVGFWGMTAIISLLYFGAIGLLWRQIKTYKTLALWVLLSMDYLLFLTQFRQALSIAFLIFAILAFNKKWYVLSVVCVVLTLLMHKSAIIIVGCIAVFYLFRKVSVGTRGYVLLVVLLLLLMFIPLQPILVRLASVLPIGQTLIDSVQHHLTLGKTFQKLLLLYLGTILCVAYYTRNLTQNKTLHWLIWCCFAVVVCLYPYYFLLNRLRSYFLPFVLVYVVNLLTQTSSRDVLPRQLYTVVIVGYFVFMMIQIPVLNKQRKAQIDNVSLVFERINHTEQELVNRQMKQAELYWDYDDPKALNLGVRK